MHQILFLANSRPISLESIILSTEPILIVGDFNLHVDADGDAAAGDLLDILESMGLEQHVTGPTHNLGHTLDLIITRQFDSIIKNGPQLVNFSLTMQLFFVT